MTGPANGGDVGDSLHAGEMGDTDGVHATLDMGRSTLSVVETTIRVDPHARLPIAASALIALSITGAESMPAGPLMGLLRDARTSVRAGATIELVGASAEVAPPMPAATDRGDLAQTLTWDQIARYTGLRLAEPSRGATGIVFERPRPAALPEQPLVSILVPGYRTDWLEDTLLSARGQTWPHIEILVGDDCPTDAVRDLVEQHAAADTRVRYVGRAHEPGGRPNMLHTLAEASGSLIKFLNDDDLLAPTCVERMVHCFQAYTDVALVSSHRQPIDGTGKPLPDLVSTARRTIVDTYIDGSSAAADLIGRRFNWVGEPTTTMFRSDALEPTIANGVPFGVTDEPSRSGGDLALWLKLLGRGDLVYLAETQSYFRQHHQQRQQQPEFRAIAKAGQDEVWADAHAIGLFEPRARHWVAGEIELRPWWSTRAQQLVTTLELENASVHLAALELELPEDPIVPLLRGQVALAEGDAGTAVALLDDAAVAHPENVAILKLLGIACLHDGRLESARKMLWFAWDRCPYDKDLEATLEALQELEPASAG